MLERINQTETILKVTNIWLKENILIFVGKDIFFKFTEKKKIITMTKREIQREIIEIFQKRKNERIIENILLRFS